MVNETHCYDICWEMREESNPEEVFTVNFSCFILVFFFFLGLLIVLLDYTFKMTVKSPELY